MLFGTAKKITLNIGVYAILFVLYNLLAFNSVFFEQVYQAGGSIKFTIGTFFCVWALISICCLILFWQHSVKFLSYLLLLINAAAFYFINVYHVVINSEMLQNVLQTDYIETRDLLSGKLLLYILLLGAIPCLLVRYLTIKPLSWKKRLGIIMALLGVILALIIPNGRGSIAFMRNHKPIKYVLVPVNYIGAMISLSKQYYKSSGSFVEIGKKSKFSPYWNNGKKNLILFVIGETARAANFSLGEYQRPTNEPLNPYLDDIVYFKNVRSCGTSTAVSVPCMFSDKKRKNYENGSALHRENVLDIMRKNGYKAVWVENNSGCKNLCTRIESTNPCKQKTHKNECLDEILLPEIPNILSQEAQNTIIVLHTIGSHGPKYYKRFTADKAPFKPICQTENIADCSQEELLNAYDNTIYYTSSFLAELIEQLKNYEQQYNVILLYVSDHGESLGENGIYLHSAPYMIAPDVQTHVPLLMWAQQDTLQALGVDENCLRRSVDNPISHDNIFHTLLGFSGISSEEYDADLDLSAKCRLKN